MTYKKLFDFLKPREIQVTSTQTQPQYQQKQEEPRYKIMGFYKETQFQETLIGRIPKEWRIAKLGELFRFRNGKRPLAIKEEGSVPVYGANGIMGYTDTALIEKDYIIVIGRVGASGKVHLAQGRVWVSDNAIYSEHYVKDEINPIFAYYMLTFLNLEKYASKTTHPLITQSFVKEISIPLPPLEEQWGIAEVLSSVDKAIEATERLIQKLEHVKKALMQELLTKGIGYKEFQETPIGKIPKEWKLTKLSNIAKIIMGQSPPSSTYNEEGIGIPFLQGKAEFGRIYVKPRLYTSKPIKIAEKGDLLISVRAPVGDVNIAPYKLCIGRGLASIRFNPTNANTFYYFYYFQHIKPMLEALGKGTTFKAITKKELEDLQVPLPPLEEQVLIANILKSIDDWIELEMRRKERLERLKRSLMDLLLSGVVRVRVAKLGSNT